MKVSVVCTNALLDIGVGTPGQAPPPQVLNVAIACLQDLIDAWNAERPCIFTRGSASYGLTSGVGAYLIGTGQTFNAPRPEWIDQAAITRAGDNPTVEYPVDGPLDEDEWAAVKIKGLQSSLPTALHYNSAFPTGTIDLYPVPNVGGLSLVLYTPTALTTPVDGTTDLLFPPGYPRAVRKNLAIELAAGPLARPIPEKLAQQATDSLAVIKRKNLRPITLRPAPTMVETRRGGTYNIRSNGYGQ